MSRPYEGRKRLVAYVLPVTEEAIKKKQKGKLSTPGKVIDALVGKPARKKGK